MSKDSNYNGHGKYLCSKHVMVIFIAVLLIPVAGSFHLDFVSVLGGLVFFEIYNCALHVFLIADGIEGTC